LVRQYEPSSTNIKILHVDVDKDHLQLTKRFLETINPYFTVVSTDLPEHALKEHEKNNFDCIVTDHVMPKLDGIELTKRIRENSDVPIILYMSQGSEEVAEQAFKVGIDDYVRKERHHAHFQVLARNVQNTVERHRANTRLRESERQFQSALDNMLEGCQIIDPQYRYLYLNSVAVRHGRRSKEELLDRTMMECDPGIEETEMFSILAKCMNERVPGKMMNQFRYPDDSTALFELSFKPVPEGTLILSIDVTEREETLHRLGESERMYRMLVEGSYLPMSVTIGDTIVYVNKKRLELTGHTDLAKLIGTSGLDDVNPDDKAIILDRLEARGADEDVAPIIRFRLTRVDGSTIHVEDHVSEAVWEGEKAVIHSLVDITDRVRYEEQLEALHRHAASLVTAENVFQVAEISLATIKTVLGFSFASFGVVEDGGLTFIYALGLDELVYRVLKLDGPGITVMAAKTCTTQLVGDTRLEPFYVSEYAENLNRVHLSELDVPVIVDGEAAAIINVEHEEVDAFDSSDVRLLELLAHHISSALIRLREKGQLTEFSKKLEALHRHAYRLAAASSVSEVGEATFSIIEDVLGFNIGSFDLVRGSYLEAVYVKGINVKDVRALPLDGLGVTVRSVITGETQLVSDTRLDTDYFSVDVEGTETRSELAVPVKVGGEVVAVINVESTEEAKFKEEDRLLVEIMAQHVASALERMWRLEEVQEMERARTREAVESAAKIDSMVRHDLRGPLSAIRSAAILLRENPERAEVLEIIDRSVSRAVEILEDLREHAWTGSLIPAPTDLVGLIRETVEGLGAPEGVNVALKLRDEVVYGRMDGAKIRRVVENLVLNALDAMPDGGELRVEEQVKDGHLVLRVSDTGVGIPSENLGKLFTPFFTTKEGGTGLGLIYCRQVVEAHGGTINVESEVGRGTSFTVKLPLG
jgi:PAS domain S-box-containing protein